MARKELIENDKRFRENIFRKFLNYTLVGLLVIISKFPFRVLYLISDVMYFLIRYVVKYRYKVITVNLMNSFPEKSAIEIGEIRNRFYRHFCDMIFESLKMYSMNEKQMSRHVSFKGLEPVDDIYNNRKSILVFAIHHSNWEWCSSIQTKLDHLVLMVYNPLRGNYAMEKFLLHSREKWGGECVPVNRTARTFIQYASKDRPSVLWLAADQTPPANSKFWTLFMNQETPFFTGPEKIAQSGNLPVYFQYVRKTGRGKYVAEYSLLFQNPAEMDAKDILLGYIRKTEEIIRNEPEYYLWSHRRWKHKRPESIELTL